MPLKTLVVIVLRLYAIYWLVDGVSEVLIYVPTVLAFYGSLWKAAPEVPLAVPYSYLLVPVGMLAIAAALWFLAARLSAAAVKGHETNLEFTSLTREDLYHFAFIFLGLEFILSSISPALQAGYKFFAMDLPLPDSNPQRGQYLWPFLGHAATLIAGFASMLGAGRWTRKLMRWESKSEVPPSV
jgi:hypothetical protein